MSSTGEISFKSDPDGADILVDGKYSGSTPSTIRIAAGDHSISVEKAHFASWKRTMSVAAGESVNVNASLEKLP